MASQASEGIGRGRALLLALLVIVAVVGAIQLAAGSGEAPSMPEKFADDDVVEVAPGVPAGRPTATSWRTAEQIREERAAESAAAEADGGGESILAKVEWGEDEDRRAYDKSVEETVKEIDGLGVYIAPAEEPKKGRGR